MKLTQRRINLLVFSLLFVAAILGLVLYFVFEPNLSYITLTATAACVMGLLLYAYWRGWEYARHVLVIVIAITVPLTLPREYLSSSTSYTLLIPIMLALVLLNPWWIAGIALAELVLVSAVAGFPNLYLTPIPLLIYFVIVGLLLLSRLAVDSVQQLAEARGQAEAARHDAEAARHEAEQRAHELEVRNHEQTRLLELVATLETPVVEIADRVLLTTLVGSLDSNRLKRISGCLLEQASLRRPRLLVLDVAGVQTIDTAVAHGLLQIARALKLLGCPTTLTGIAPEVAHTLSHLQVDLSEVSTRRSPEEALRQHVVLS